MSKKNRIEYLICTLSVFTTAFVIYGLLGSITPFVNESPELSFLLLGGLGGFVFSALVSTIILSVSFFKKRGTTFKLVASILWPITLAICVYAGILSYIPYQIINVVKLISITKEEKNSQNPQNNL